MTVKVVREFTYRGRWEFGVHWLSIGGGFHYMVFDLCLAGWHREIVFAFGQTREKEKEGTGDADE